MVKLTDNKGRKGRSKMPTNDNIRAYRNYDDWKTSPPEYPEPDESLVCFGCGDEISDSQYENTKEKTDEKDFLDTDENILYCYGFCSDCQ